MRFGNKFKTMEKKDLRGFRQGVKGDVTILDDDGEYVTIDAGDSSFDFEFQQAPRVKGKERILEKHPAKNAEYIDNIVREIYGYNGGNDEDKFEASDKLVDESISPESIGLIETVLTEDLKSATKNGVSVFQLDGGITVREKEQETFLSRGFKSLLDKIMRNPDGELIGYLGEEEFDGTTETIDWPNTRTTGGKSYDFHHTTHSKCYDCDDDTSGNTDS